MNRRAFLKGLIGACVATLPATYAIGSVIGKPNKQGQSLNVPQVKETITWIPSKISHIVQHNFTINGENYIAAEYVDLSDPLTAKESLSGARESLNELVVKRIIEESR